MKDRLDLSTTQDGSSTLYSTRWNAHYHSTHGAIQESIHVFINAGLKHWLSSTASKNVSILEYGMGTGLNVLLTQDYALKNEIHIDYETIEAYPITEDIASKLNYSADNALPSIQPIHQAPWGKTQALNSFFDLQKHNLLFEDFTSDDLYDVIFYDAFGPGAQPSLWEEKRDDSRI